MIGQIKLLHDRVMILPNKADEKTKGGIIIPDTAKEVPVKGTIFRVGPGKANGPKMTLKEGDTVIYGKYGGTELEWEGNNYMLLREDEVMAVEVNGEIKPIKKLKPRHQA